MIWYIVENAVGLVGFREKVSLELQLEVQLLSWKRKPCLGQI